METRITSKLNEIYNGIVAFGTRVYSFFGVVDYASLAASAVNYLIKTGEINSYEKRTYSRYMVDKFNQDIGGTIGYNDIMTVVDYMDGVTGIDRNLAGILAAIEMAR